MRVYALKRRPSVTLRTISNTLCLHNRTFRHSTPNRVVGSGVLCEVVISVDSKDLQHFKSREWHLLARALPIHAPLLQQMLARTSRDLHTNVKQIYQSLHSLQAPRFMSTPHPLSSFTDLLNSSQFPIFPLHLQCVHLPPLTFWRQGRIFRLVCSALAHFR